MSHLAGAAICSWLPGSSVPAAKTFRLSSPQVDQLTNFLKSDALGMHYSALVSFIDAVNGISSGQFSWATVQLYYTCFYSARILLAANSTAIFYVSGKPFSLVNSLNNPVRQEQGVTHEVIWRVLERELPNSPLLGSIGMDKAFAWMKKLREDINYRNPRFQEPLVPDYFGRLSILGIRKTALTYINDTSLSYSFDPEHAAFAFPLECLKRSSTALFRETGRLAKQDLDYLTRRMNSAQLPYPLISQLLGLNEVMTS